MVQFNRIAQAGAKKLVGMRRKMSFAQNTTALLWQSFMPRRKEIKNAVSEHLYSLQIYAPGFFANFDPQRSFEKWALKEISAIDAIPADMEAFALPQGTYAVFDYKGNAAEAAAAFQYIFTQWLPASAYNLDDRPHFEILGEKYKRDQPDSEEEIWIPVILK